MRNKLGDLTVRTARCGHESITLTTARIFSAKEKAMASKKIKDETDENFVGGLF